MRRLLLVVSVLGVLMPVVGQAQTPVVNPLTVTFTASADHAATLPDGTAMVTRYEIRHFLTGATSPVQVGNLAKPAPVSGVITASITGSLASLPFSPTQVYTAKIAAIGPTGEGVSAASNPFIIVSSPAAPGTPTVSR